MQPTTNNIQIFYNIIQIFFKTQFLHFSFGTRDAADPCIKKFVWLKYFSSFVFVSVPLGCAVIKYKLYGRIVFSFPWLSSNAGDRRFTITINYTDQHTIKAFLLSLSYTRYGKMVLIPMVWYCIWLKLWYMVLIYHHALVTLVIACLAKQNKTTLKAEYAHYLAIFPLAPASPSGSKQQHRYEHWTLNMSIVSEYSRVAEYSRVSEYPHEWCGQHDPRSPGHQPWRRQMSPRANTNTE